MFHDVSFQPSDKLNHCSSWIFQGCPGSLQIRNTLKLHPWRSIFQLNMTAVTWITLKIQESTSTSDKSFELYPLSVCLIHESYFEYFLNILGSSLRTRWDLYTTWLLSIWRLRCIDESSSNNFISRTLFLVALHSEHIDT